MVEAFDLHGTAAAVLGVVLDVDGVLTDGRIVYADDGSESKQFHVQDGASIKLIASHGIAVGIISGRRSSVVQRRAEELGISHVLQGVSSKADALDQLLDTGFPARYLAAVGDDLADLELYAHPAVALSISVPNAHPVVRDRAHFVTRRAGGEGIVVEVAELLLKARDQWHF